MDIEKMVPTSMQAMIDEVKKIYENDPKIAQMFEKGFTNTYQTTIKSQPNGDTFVITGDIPAMWNRDSVAQVRPLLYIAKDCEQLQAILKGVMKLHQKQILLDSYANAHNLYPQVGDHSEDDLTKSHPLVWERKYEVDSLCYPVQLAYLYWKNCNDSTIFDADFLKMCKQIVEVFTTEQNHHQKSPYSFRRIADWLLFDHPDRIEFETLPNRGRGREVNYTGMTWSGFRPSDDACHYGYLVPANMFAVVILKYMAEICLKFYSDEQSFFAQIVELYEGIDEGIRKHAIVEHPKYGKMYAYEVDGYGNHLLMDDANVPSLLSAPYLGYVASDDPIYINTRNFILSKDNPYYYEGKVAKGVGSAHTPPNYFWHISLAIEAMTCDDQNERERILMQFKNTDANTLMMHEGIDVDDPNNFTRPWFSWANSMFAEFILNLNGYNLIKEQDENSTYN